MHPAARTIGDREACVQLGSPRHAHARVRTAVPVLEFQLVQHAREGGGASGKKHVEPTVLPGRFAVKEPVCSSFLFELTRALRLAARAKERVNEHMLSLLRGGVRKKAAAARARPDQVQPLLCFFSASVRDACGYAVVPRCRAVDGGLQWTGFETISLDTIMQTVARGLAKAVSVDVKAGTVTTLRDKPCEEQPRLEVISRDRENSMRVNKTDIYARLFAAVRCCLAKKCAVIMERDCLEVSTVEEADAHIWTHASLKLLQSLQFDFVFDLDRGCLKCSPS